MRHVTKGLLIGSIVGSAVGILVTGSARGGWSPNTKRMVNKVGKIFRDIL